MSKSATIYATCTDSGEFIELIMLYESEIITEAEEENEDGVYYCEYVEAAQNASFYLA